MIDFVKMEGAGNDYIYVLALPNLKGGKAAVKLHENIRRGKYSRPWLQRLCDRHFGLGSDGLIFGCVGTNKAEFSMAMFNSDGSESEMCGNGVRSLGLLLYSQGLVTNKFAIQTLGGVKGIEIHTDSTPIAVTVDMGVPNFDPASLPAHFPNTDGVLSLFTFYPGPKQLTCKGMLCSMGNPHLVVLEPFPPRDPYMSRNYPIEEKLKLENLPLKDWGDWIQKDPRFPHSVNVNLMEVRGRNKIAVRTYERGAGETMACGTGVSASAACALHNGLVEQGPVEIQTAGGLFKAVWAGQGQPVYLSGPSRVVFTGQFEPENFMPHG